MRARPGMRTLLARGVAALFLLAQAFPAEAGAEFCRTWSGFEAEEGEGRTGRTLLRNSDLFNGIFWVAGAGSIRFAADPSRDWKETNSFDRGRRNDLVASSRNGRSDAAAASDGLLAISLLSPLIFDAGYRSWVRDRDCDRALEIASDWTESIGFIWLVTEATKTIAGRERPLGRGCDVNSNYASDCDEDTRFKGFFSGHASLAAGGAALLCKDAYKRNVWGDNPLTRGVICGLGVGAAVGTGLLRTVADKHWMTDVFAGWAVGALIGWFDIPGPFDLLSFRYERNGVRVEGAWTPTLGRESVGLAMRMRF